MLGTKPGKCPLLNTALPCDVSQVMVERQSNRASPQLTVDPESLAALIDRLRLKPRIAIDTEAASFHRYVDRVYLIQISSDEETAIIDPLAIDDLAPLGSLLADPMIEVILHDADYDLRTLNRDYGFHANNLFDTRVAAQLSGEPSVGLGSLLDKYFGIKVDKKYQRADWSRRPLSPEMIRYATDDTRYLPELRDQLEERLRECGRLEWAREEFRQLEGLRWTQPDRDGQAHLRVKGAKNLPPRTLAIFRQLYNWRDSTAAALDRAPFRVLGNSHLLSIARAAPVGMKRLSESCGLPTSVVRRFGKDLLNAVSEGLAIPKERFPTIERRSRPAHNPVYDRSLERLKALRNRRARDLDMQPGLLCPNGTLQAVARTAPSSTKALRAISEIRAWQVDALGEGDILAAVQGKDS